MSAPSAPVSSARSFWEKLPPGQQMMASILSFIFAIPVLGVLAGGRLAGLAAIVMPLGIIWSILYFRAKQREYDQRLQPPPAQMYTPPQPMAFHTPSQPMASPVPPPLRTNPLEESPPVQNLAPPSVTEGETQRLPPPRQAQ